MRQFNGRALLVFCGVTVACILCTILPFFEFQHNLKSPVLGQATSKHSVQRTPKREPRMSNSYASVLRNPLLSPFLDSQTFPLSTSSGGILPRVFIVFQDPDAICDASWEEARALGGKMNEMLQEVGFIHFFAQVYPYGDVISLDEFLRQNISDDSLVFLPFCPYTQGYLGRPKIETKSLFSIPLLGQLFGKHEQSDEEAAKHAYKFVNNHRQHQMVAVLEKYVHPDRIFYVSNHPMFNPEWKHKLNLVRTLRVDSTVHGNRWDIIIPQSTKEDLCPVAVASTVGNEHVQDPRETLIFGVGKIKWGVQFEGLRKDIFDAFNNLNKVDIDCKSKRSINEYSEGFSKSKFCLVIPGDTASTSQGTRAVCAKCVPVYIVPDFRDLPYANILDYSTFSVRVLISDLLKEGGVERLYLELQGLVENGMFRQMKDNLELVGPLFNYHEFGHRSPYLASLLSILEDNRVKDQRV
mmetsp:Transcript_14990/g.30830  ORF Transcript_14990/g.30830 Transcript_14990/m.30830 type:complete len:467 (-) Transcript_14990:1438-2838(-)